MTPSNKKFDCVDHTHIDRISDLPSDVVGSILAHLPITDRVRTSILSRKWRYMWVSVPQLEFENQFFEKCEHFEGTEISGIITDVLLLHNDPVYKFTLHIPDDRVIRIEYFNKWILFLSRSGIKHLELVNQPYSFFQIPSRVFSCQELTYLELQNFKLLVPPNYCGFKSLLVLKFYDIEFKSSVLESLISGCPLLEELTISSCYVSESIDVSAPTLKVLSIDDSSLIKSICPETAKNLIDLTLMASDQIEVRRVCDLIKGSPKIERLVTGTHYIGILSGDTFPQFIFLKYLEFDILNLEESRQVLFIVSLLKSAPNLVELVIKGGNFGGSVGNRSVKLECDWCCLSKLKKVNFKFQITCNETSRLEKCGTHAMSLIRFILAKSSSLKTLTFNVDVDIKQMGALALLSISQDLLQMERASPRAQVKFLYKDIVGL